MNRSVIATHHVVQQSLVNHDVIQLIGGRSWIEANANKLHLTTDIDVARATGTALHSSNHPWVASAQEARLDAFLQRTFGGHSATDLLENPSLNPAAYDTMRTEALRYVDDIRDTTARAIVNGNLPLTLTDPRFPGITSTQAGQMADNLLSPARFAAGEPAALTRQAELADFRTTRAAIDTAGGDSRWMALDSPQKVTTYLDETARLGVSPTNTRAATAASLASYVESIDDGTVSQYLDNRAAAQGIPSSRWSRLPLGAKIGIFGIVATTIVGLNQANSANSVEERNDLLEGLSVGVALEVTALALGLGFLPAVILTTAGYALYSYATDAETRQVVNDFVSTSASNLAQMTTRLFTGQSLATGPVSTQLVAAPDSQIVPFISGLNSIPHDPPEPGAEPFDFAAYVSALDSDWSAFHIDEDSWVRYTEDGTRYDARVIYAGPVAIAFIVNTDSAPNYESTENSSIPLPRGTMVLIVSPEGSDVDGDGAISFTAIGFREPSSTPINDSNVDEIGSGIINSMRLAAERSGQPSPSQPETRQVTRGNASISTTLVHYGPSSQVMIRVAENGYDQEVNTATIVQDVIMTGRGSAAGPSEPLSISRTVTVAQGVGLVVNAEQPGTVLHRYRLERDEQGQITYSVDGEPVSAEVARGEHGAVFAEMESKARLGEEVAYSADEDTRPEIVGSAPRDLAASQEQGTTQMVIAVRELLGTFPLGDSIVTVSSRLVANRLANRYLAQGREFVPQDEFESAFKAARDHQIVEIRVAGQIGGVFGSTLGRALAGDDRLAGVLLGGVLGSLTTSVGQAVGTALASDSLSQGYRTGLAELPTNLGRAAVGAISSFITAELIKAVGLDGFIGELANTAAGAVIGQILSNLSGLNGVEAVRDLLTGLDATLVLNAVGSFLGSKLASELIEFDTIGGQLGSAIGSAIGSIGGVALVTGGGLFASQLVFLGMFAGPIGAAVGAFLGYILGGLIGSVFAGTPRSGADTQWNEAEGRFVVANVWSRKGGSKDAARSVATVVADSFNGLLGATGGVLLEPEAVQAGNYGMRKKAFVYRPTSTQDKHAITASFTGEDAAQRLISHGVAQGLADPDFKIAGGDVYIKRALYNSPAKTGTADGTVDIQSLVGDLTIASDWSFYRNNPGAIEIISSTLQGTERDTYLAGWIATAARAADLGLDRRHVADWFGGFTYLLEEAGATAASTDFYFDYDFASDKYSRAIRLGRFLVTDSVDIAGQTFIELGSSDDVIDLRQGFLADQRGLIVNSKLNDDIAADGEDFIGASNAPIAVAANRHRAEIALAIMPNVAGEQEESFGVGLVAAEGMAVFGRDATVTIVGANALPHLQVGRSFATEADGYAVFRISLSRAADTALSLSLSVDGKEAVLGTDLTSSIEVSADPAGGWVSSSTLTIAAGVQEYFARVPIVSDNGVDAEGEPTGVEPNEQFTLGARVTTGMAALSNGNLLVTGIGNILDGSSSEPIVWADDAIVHAGQAATVSFGISRLTQTGAQVTVSTFDRRALHIDIAATVDAGDGDDIVHTSDYGDNVFGGSGNDTLYGGRLDDWLLGDEGNDTLHAAALLGGLGGDGNYLQGGEGDDTLYGAEGSDWLEGGAGADMLDGGGGDDILAGGAGAGDVEKGGHGDDQYLVRLGDGADTANEVASGAVYNAPSTPGVDAVHARFEGIQLNNIARNWFGDSLDIERAEEESTRPGGTYTVAAVAAGGDDAIVFGEGIGIGNIRLTRLGGTDGADLLVEVTALNEAGTDNEPTGTQLVVTDWFANSFKRVEWLKFADGTEIQLGNITSFIAGTAGDDVIVGTLGNDFAYAGSGDDALHLLAGDDIGNGGSGDDLVAGDDGRDLLIGGLGDDRLIGGRGDDSVLGHGDTLSGDAGNDDLYGGVDNDILSGGRGDDQVVGGAGDDVFKFARGDGRDTVFDEFSDHWVAVWSAAGWAPGYTRNEETGEVTAPDGSYIRKNLGTFDEPDMQWLGRFDYDHVLGQLYRYNETAAGTASVANSGTDTIEFALGISIQDIVLTRTSTLSNDLILTVSRENEELASYAAGSDSITIKNWYSVPGQIEKFAFYQTGEISVGPAGVNLVAGTDANNGTTSTPLAGTAAVDWISGGSGDDVLAGGTGNDILSGNSGFDTLRGEAGDDVLYGGSGNDTLDGGVGSDLLFGGSGMDTATYASTNTPVRAYLSASWANAGGSAGDTYVGIENLSGGTSGDYPGGIAGDVLGGDDGDNELSGGRGDDRLMGGGGNDSYMWNGADWIDTIVEGVFIVQQAVTAAGALEVDDGYAVSLWQQTADLRPDGSGDYYWRLQVTGPGGEIVYDWDRYAPTEASPAQPAPAGWDTRGWLGGFVRTASQQVIREKFDTAADGGDDSIEFGPGLSFSDLSFERWGAGGRDDDGGVDLLIRYGAGNLDYMMIKNQYTAAGELSLQGGVETLLFRDGLTVSLADILIADVGAPLVGTDADELLTALNSTAIDQISGGGGNDVLSGLRGNDTLEGGDGDDILEGGVGADTLDGGANSAPNSETAWGDTVRYVKSAVNVDLRRIGAQPTTGNGEAAGDILIGIENVVGSATGNDTLSGDDLGNRLDGLDGVNNIHGWGGDDVVTAGTGADLLYGDGGDDGVSGGEGADQLWGGDGNDRLDGGAGNDRLWGDEGADILTGGDGDDTILEGGAGDDQIMGGAGADTLTGGGDDDLLEGGAGIDILQGGEGDDRYLFRPGSGQDTLTDASGDNILQFADGIDFDRLWLTQVGQDLRIGVIGTLDVVKVVGFFAASSTGLVRAIETAGHAIFLDHPAPRALIAAMTSAPDIAADTTPDSMPLTIVEMLADFWHQGGKAVPEGPALRALSTNEDTALAIDGSVGVVDQDDNIIAYSLMPGAGPANGTVTIDDAATGGVTYTPGPDFSGEDWFSLLVTDADGQIAEIPIMVTVAAVNDGPANLRVANGVPLAVAEAAPMSATATGTAVGQLAATDPEGNAVEWTLIDDEGGRFNITIDGLLSVDDALLLNHEVDDEHTVRVRATDFLGAFVDGDFAVTVLDANEANAFGPIPDMAVGENAAAGAHIATVPPATDVDGGIFGQQRYYFLDGTATNAVSPDGRFAIDEMSGAVRVHSALDYEDGTPVGSYAIVARDNAGGAGFNQVSAALTITVQDANEQNTFGSIPDMTADENRAEGTVIGSVPQAEDPDEGLLGEQRYYFLVGTAISSLSFDARYVIHADTGTITTNLVLDHEAMTAPVTYTVAARDNQGGDGYTQADSDVTIRVGDLNEANSLVAPSPRSVAENGLGTLVYTVTAGDLDLSTSLNGRQHYHFSIGADVSQTSSDGRYRIELLTGAITTAIALDYETMSVPATYQVVARDRLGGTNFLEAQASIEIGVTNVNEQVTLAAAFSFSVPENTAAAIAVGTVVVGDPDSNATAFGRHSFRFMSDGVASLISSDGLYSIDSISGVIKTSGALDYETMTAPRTYQVRVRDNEGAAGFTEAFTNAQVAITNVNEAPATPLLPVLPPARVAESAAGWVAQFTLSDPDGTVPTLRFTSNPGSRFAISGSEVRFVGAASPNFETLHQQLTASGVAPVDGDGDGLWEFALTGAVDATDGALPSPGSTGFAVSVEDVNEAPTGTSWSAAVTSVDERDHPQTGADMGAIQIGTVGVIDPDIAGLATNRYNFTVSDSRFQMIGGVLYLKAGAALDREAGATVALTVTATDDTAALGLVAHQITAPVTVNVNDLIDYFYGDNLGNTLTGQSGRDYLYGYGDSDTLYAGAGDDFLYGGTGRDWLYGEDGADELFGEGGAENKLDGGAGNDTLRAGDEGDELHGGAGNDRLFGGLGVDHLYGGAHDDELHGGGSIDFAHYDYAWAGVSVDLDAGTATGAGNDTLEGIENVVGTAYDDTLRGDEGDNRLEGGAGSDQLWGGLGADDLYGGAGIDTLRGEAGNDYFDGGADDDILIGGENNDLYYFARFQGNDRIQNYNLGSAFDQIALATDILYTHVWFERVNTLGAPSASGSNLKLSILGDTGIDGTVTVENWFVEPVEDFQVDLISDGGDHAARPIDVGGLLGLMSAVPAAQRPTTKAGMEALRNDPAFANELADHWKRLIDPSISAIANQSSTEPLDNAPGTLSFSVRAWYPGANGIAIPASSIVLELTALNGNNLAEYIVGEPTVSTPDAAGNRTVTLQLTPNGSTHLLANGVLPLQMTARIDGTNRSTATGFSLTVAPTADTPTLSQASSVGGKAGTYIPITIIPTSQDPSEQIHVLIGNLPAGYTLTNATGTPLGVAEGALRRLTAAEVQVLHMWVPAGSHLNASLSVTPRATDGASVRNGATTTLAVSVNGAPTSIALAGSVAENAAASTFVGTLSAVDPDTAETGATAQSFALTNNAGGRYMLDPNNSSRLLVATGGSSLFNYEAASRDTLHTITVTVTDNGGNTLSRTIVVPVTNVNEQNALGANTDKTVAENLAAATVVGTVALATDPDLPADPFGQQRYYFSNGTDLSVDSRYRINATTGQITTAAVLNYEGGTASVVYNIIARDNQGLAGYTQAASTVRIIIGNVNEQNVLGANTDKTINENVVVGTAVATVTLATDPDLPADPFGQQRYYFSNGTDLSVDSRYRINATTGQITTAALLDFEAPNPSVVYNIIARDNQGLAGYTQAASTVRISIANLNEQNALATIPAMNVNENMISGTVVGQVPAATDPDSAAGPFGQQRYYFSNGLDLSADGRYRINATTGQITTAAVLSFEGGTPSVNYTVLARDNAGAAGYKEASATVQISINNLNEQNALAAIPAMSVSENLASGTVVGTVPLATDPDALGTPYGDQRYFFWDGTNPIATTLDGRYGINQTTGQITTARALSFEEATPVQTYSVVVRDNAGAPGFTQDISTVQISLLNVNEQNALGTVSPMSVSENMATGTVVGQVPAATDPDSAAGPFGQQRYYFSNGLDLSADGRYRINATTGQITTAAILNFEAGTTTVTYGILARDNAGAAGYKEASSSVQISLLDVNEQNALAAIPAMSVNENAASGTSVGTVPAATDPDSPAVAFGQQRYFFWYGGVASLTSFDSRYAINSTTGQITTAAVLNFEAGSTSVTYSIAARDNLGAAGFTQAVQNVQISVNNLNEQNALGATAAMAVYENVAVGTAVGTVTQATDPDSAAIAFGQQRYYFSNGLDLSADGRYRINATTGQITTAAALDFEAGTTSVSYGILARDNAGAAGYTQATNSVTISIQDVNEPHSLQTAAFTVWESNTPLGPWIAVPTTGGAVINLRNSMLSDPEGHNMRWQFSNGTTTSGSWQIEQDGTLRMVGGVDYEAMTEVWEWQTYYDWEGYPYEEYVLVGRDPSLAVFNLAVQAIDDNNALVREATLTLNVADVNEHVTTSSYATYSVHDHPAAVTKNSETNFYVYGEIFEGNLLNIGALDPEGRPLSYSISNITNRDINISGNAHNDIDSGYPVLSINSYGTLTFYLPTGSGGSSDIAWQGGTRTALGRRTHSIEYTFNVNITDSVGLGTTIPYTVTFVRRGSSVPPIVLDLDGDGLELVAHEGSTVDFDMDADGIADRTGWVAADDGLLALDRNGNGLIDDIREISFVGDASGAISDLEGLVAYDSNANGLLDAGDERFADFRVWQDLDQDGVSQAGELRSLTDADIVSLSLTLTPTGEQPGGSDNVVYATSHYVTADGTSRQLGDVFFSFDPSNLGEIAAPIVFDYDGDGSGLVALDDSQVRFDMDGDGTLDRTGWVMPGDALLALDRNADGEIAGIAEISFVADLAGANTDLEGLAAFDSNGDGILDTHDNRFGEFKLWFDNNSNGTSDAGEILTLAQAGIAGIGLAGSPVAAAPDGPRSNVIYASGRFTRDDASEGSFLDAGFAYLPGQVLPPAVAAASPPAAPAASLPPSPPAAPAASLPPAPPASPPTSQAAPEPSPSTPSVSPLAMARQSFGRKSGAYRLRGEGGALVMTQGRARGAADGAAVGPASLLSFRNRTIGLLGPLVVDLDGNGVELKSRKGSDARFDMDGDGSADDTGWISRNDGFLVVDADGDGRVSSPGELSLLALKADARNSLEALATLDSNRDGRVDAEDARFGELRIWRDRNGNGISEAGELATLADHGIVSAGLAGKAASGTAKAGENLVFLTSSFTRADGSVGTLGDAALAFRPSGRSASAARISRFEDWDFESAGAANVASGGAEAPPADLRVAQMIQQMASFGPRSGQGDWRDGSHVHPQFEYFA